jgi:hypothetical protein
LTVAASSTAVEKTHGEGCPCTRCTGFLTKHGAFSPATISPRASQIASAIADCVPARTDGDDLVIGVLAGVVARIERVYGWLDEQEHGIFTDAHGTPQPILKMLSVWENSAQRLCDRLGLTPLSRAQLGLDLVRTKGEALRAHVQENYADGAVA